MKAWQLFKSRKNWCQGAWSRDINGMSVTTYDQYAVSYCAAGAIRRIYPMKSQTVFGMESKLYWYVLTKTGFNSIVRWNDHKNQRWSRVKAVLKRLDI